MSQPLLKQPFYDPTWDAIRQAAEALARQEPILRRLSHDGVLNQACFEDALSYILAQELKSRVRLTFADLARVMPPIEFKWAH